MTMRNDLRVQGVAMSGLMKHALSIATENARHRLEETLTL
jgi:hypothetical protein